METYYQVELEYNVWTLDNDFENCLVKECIGRDCDDFPTLEDFKRIPGSEHIGKPFKSVILAHDYDYEYFEIIGTWEDRLPTAEELEALRKECI